MTVAFQDMFGILERWNNNEVTPSLSKPQELSYRSNNISKKLELNCPSILRLLVRWLKNIGFRVRLLFNNPGANFPSGHG